MRWADAYAEYAFGVNNDIEGQRPWIVGLVARLAEERRAEKHLPRIVAHEVANTVEAGVRKCPGPSIRFRVVLRRVNRRRAAELTS